MYTVGLVGYGFMGKMHAQCYAASGEAKVVALADTDPAKRKEAKTKLGCEVFSSVEEMLAAANPDIADVCTPTFLHEEHVRAAARAGKHVLCEKPMSLTVASCTRMIQTIRKARVIAMIAHAVRFVPEYQVVKDLVASGKVGKVKWLSASRVSPPADWSWQNWLFDPERSGGGILDLQIHDIDYFNWLLGVPRTVAARAVKGKKGGLDTALTLMQHEGGPVSYAQGCLDMSATCPFNMSLLVNCTKATIRYDLSASPTLMVYPASSQPYAPELPAEEIAESTESVGNIKSLGPYLIEIKYFLGCVKAGKQPKTVTLEQARDAVRVCLAATKAAKTGRTVAL